jgi:hypothetical protein
MVNGRLERESNPPTGQLASPVPQYKIPGEDNYEKLEGEHGASFTKIKDAGGNIVSPATEEKLEQARVLLNTISTKDFATQTTLAAVLAKLEQLETEIQAVKANQISGDQKVQQVGTIPVIFISRLEDRPSATEVEIGQFVILTDEELPTWVSNGVNWVEVL